MTPQRFKRLQTFHRKTLKKPWEYVHLNLCSVDILHPFRIYPKGLPQPTGKTSYAVYISLKQWRKVEPKLKDPADTLIIEGFPLVDEAFNGISVMATNTSTRKLKQEQAAALQAKSQASAGATTV